LEDRFSIPALRDPDRMSSASAGACCAACGLFRLKIYRKSVLNFRLFEIRIGWLNIDRRQNLQTF
jgi:hypothetical protein